MRRIVLSILLVAAMMTSPCLAKTLVVAGRLSSEVTVKQQVTFGVDQKLSVLTYRFPVPAAITVPSLSQKIIDHRLSFNPQPDSVADETDAYGNRYKVASWRELSRDARVDISFTTDIDAVLDPLAVRSPFPVPAAKVPEEARLYLKPSKLVQSRDPEIAGKAAELTAGMASQSAAVDAILNFVTDHIRYETPPKAYDALYGFTSGTGNCQNFAHLACALLRASGIPARVAVGLTLKEKWKIPLDNRGSSLVQGMGEGLHAWIEVFYPDLGWLPYDPQQSKQFTSTRHIKYAHGPQCGEIGTSWRGSPVLPRYDSAISTHFTKDVVDLNLKGSGSEPRGYMASNEMVQAAPEPEPQPPVPPVAVPTPVPVPVVPVVPAPLPVPKPRLEPRPEPGPKPGPKPEPPPVPAPEPLVPTPVPGPTPLPVPVPAPPEPKLVAPKPPVPVARPVKPAKKPVERPRIVPDKDGAVVIGNTRFPKMVSLYTTSGDRGEAALEQETAEYVSSSGIYAQAFIIDQPLKLEKVSLAMKKFGGDGTVYVDIVADDGGKPGLVNGVRSNPVYLEKVKRLPGYGWLDFSIEADAQTFKPGKYWVVFRRSGEAIMNWFYTPGKPYGGPDDTRSTARGWQWEDVLPYDFVFKVAGRVSK